MCFGFNTITRRCRLPDYSGSVTASVHVAVTLLSAHNETSPRLILANVSTWAPELYCSTDWGSPFFQKPIQTSYAWDSYRRSLDGHQSLSSPVIQVIYMRCFKLVGCVASGQYLDGIGCASDNSVGRRGREAHYDQTYNRI